MKQDIVLEGLGPCSFVNMGAISGSFHLQQATPTSGGRCALGGGDLCAGSVWWLLCGVGRDEWRPGHPSPHISEPTCPCANHIPTPLATLTANITSSSLTHRIVCHVAHLLQLDGGMVDGVSVVWWLGRGAGSGQPGPHHQALSTGVSAREVERVSGGCLATRRGGHRGNRQNIFQERCFGIAGLTLQC